MKMNRNISMKMKKTLAWMLVLLLLTAVCPLFVQAAGVIDTTRDACLHILYQNGDTKIEGAKFEVYSVAEVDEYARMTVTDAFSAYPIDFDDIDQEGWQALAATLKGYVQRDGVASCAEGTTDADGRTDITVKPGLYLVFAGPVSMDGVDTYFSDPFIVFLPVLDEDTNTWVYETEARPKNTHYTTARKVMKIWEDDGYETVRPEAIVVDLLCDGNVTETVELSDENNWRYDWGSLDPMHEWQIVERVPEGYYGKTSQNGEVFTVTNKFIEPVTADEITVIKRITGDKPPKDIEFTFVLTANETGNPMPKEAEGDTLQKSIVGAGVVSMGKIDFDKVGEYSYEVREIIGNEKGWTYDDTVYTVTFTITESEGELSVKQVIQAKDEEREAIIFTNSYEEPLPQTGLLWWPVPALLLVGLVFVVMGCALRKDDGYER